MCFFHAVYLVCAEWRVVSRLRQNFSLGASQFFDDEDDDDL